MIDAKLIKTANIILIKAHEEGINAEVVCTALQIMKNKPDVSIIEALARAANDWNIM